MSDLDPAQVPTAGRAAFPRTVEDFESDERVSYSKLDNKWILEDEDGWEWEFDERQNKWIPSLDERLLQQQGQAYAVEGVDESESAQQVQQQRKKRRKLDNADSQEHGPNKKQQRKGNGNNATERKNTAVYVTSLPLNTDVDEVNKVFSRCGVIAEEIDSGNPRIKLYADESGNFKGDALIVYFRAESVSLAIQLLDDTDFRLGETGPAGKMQVKEADWSYKKVQDKPNGASERSSRDQKKIIKKTQKLNNKLADWDDDDPQTLQETSSRYDKVVILKHMFTLEELEEDPAAILDIKEDIREECSKLGKLGNVTNVVLFDKEPAGVASVRFSNTEAASACVRLMEGRMFGGQRVKAFIADGSERFKKSDSKKAATQSLDDEEDEDSEQTEGDDAERGQGSSSGQRHRNGGGDEQSKRLDEFGRWLEQDS